MPLEIQPDLLEQIRRHAAEAYPEECCGVMLGEPTAAGTRVVRLVRAENTREDAARHHRYLIEPATILRCQREARAEGLDIVGYYHSHPDHPARPSDFDREHAWPGTSYVIVAVEQGEPAALHSWKLSDDRSTFEEEPISPGDPDSRRRPMSVAIQIPTPLRRFTDEQGEVTVDAATVGEAMEALVSRFDALRPHLYTEDGKLRSFVNLFKNDEDVRFLDREQTALADGDHLTIIPSIAGGAS
ncbi:MAG TPA: Mov34/MPN/PAD-1 family protein [Thermoanaerobaculia bacterium]|nr:Mov34/MPN/PAD-1 family protein [Thermoanaerobaculia bacterium]